MAKQFSDNYLKKLDKVIQKKEKETKQKVIYRFSYVNRKERICLDTIGSITKGLFSPTFVKYDGNTQTHELCKEFMTPDGFLIAVPPYEQELYRDLYEEILFPDTIIEDKVPMEAIDDAITNLLKTWFKQPEEYFVVARNFIKFTWVYERFRYRPYLSIHGDWGTGKTEWGTFITQLSHYGLCVEDISAPTLARILDMTNSVIMLDEMDFIDRSDSEKIRRILRNGYKKGGKYRVTEQETKKFYPASFLVDQPKLLIKRNITKDDALLSRMIPFKMIPRDKEVPISMRRNDEVDWDENIKGEARRIVSLLLRWRWQNIFEYHENILVPEMNMRFNDTIMPLLKVASDDDQMTIIRYMKQQEKVAIDTASDDFRLQLVKLLVPLYHRTESLFGTGVNKIFITDIGNQAKEEFAEEMTDSDLKRLWSSRNIKRGLLNMGFELDMYGNKNYIKPDSLLDLLPRLCQKYSIKLEKDEENNEDNEIKEEIKDIVVDNSI